MKLSEGTVLIIDDDADVLFSVKMLLKDYFKTVKTITEPQLIHETITQMMPDIILLDMNYSGSETSGREGLYWLRRIMEYDHPPVVIMMTAFGTVDLAIAAMKEGAVDFVLKPWQNEKLLATLSSGLELKNSKREVGKLQTERKMLRDDIDKKSGEFIGESAQMKELFAMIAKVAKTDANVLITGENGTGKELVARSIHRQSLRSNKPLVTVDLGAISETLFESELFGHVKGAFTDAREERAGRFEIASGGTLFLDEIGNIPLPLQAKLLTALQSRQVTRIGSNKAMNVDIRLVCATNMPVYELVDENAFREDLLYRIKTIELHLPPLREREGDIVLLSDHFLEIYCRKYRKLPMKLGVDTLHKLEAHHWPGNVRELQHAIERAVIMSDARILKSQDFSFGSSAKRQTAKESLNLDNLETEAIRKALNKHGMNISKAALELGLSRAALYRKMDKYDIR